MANNKTIYARFYPKEGVKIVKIFWIKEIEALREEIMFWKIYYGFELKENFVDIIYTGKPKNELPELFSDEKIIKKFDIWLRLSDEGSFHDIIGCKSTSISFSNKKDFVAWLLVKESILPKAPFFGVLGSYLVTFWHSNFNKLV